MPETAIFDPPPGLALGESDYSMPGRWSAGDNVRFVNGRAQPIGGWTTGSVGAFTDGISTNALEWLDDGGNARVIWGRTNGLWVTPGNANITPAGFTTATRWSLDIWGERPVACPTGGTIHEWDLNIGNDAVALSNAPDNVTCIGVSETRQLFAFGCNEEAAPFAYNGRCIRWSDVENNNDWTTTPSNLAGEYVLDGAGGRIRAAKKIGAYWGVWTDDEVFLGRFTGDPASPWLFERQATGCGCLGMDAVAVVDGAAYWITRDLRLMGWLVGAPPFPLPGLPVHFITFTADVDKTGMTNSFAWHNRAYNEVWFHYVVNGSGSVYPTAYIAVNLDSLRGGAPAWFTGTIGRALIHQGITAVYGVPGVTFGGYYLHETGRRGLPGNGFSWSISALVYFDQGQRRTEIQRLIPDVTDQSGNVTFTLSKLDYPQGVETVLQTKVLAPGEDKSDFRAGGKLFRFAWSGSDANGSADTFARLGRQAFEHVAEGAR